MASRTSQPAENFDSTAKLMLEALAKASAELERSVTVFTEQLISFNEALQKTLDEELKSVDQRLEACIKSNLDELSRNKELMLQKLLEAEREELDSIVSAGRQVRSAINVHSVEVEETLKNFVDSEMAALKQYLQEPEQQLKSTSGAATDSMERFGADSSQKLSEQQAATSKLLSDKLSEIEAMISSETEKARTAIVNALEDCENNLQYRSDSAVLDLAEITRQSMEELSSTTGDAMKAVAGAEKTSHQALDHVREDWKKRVDGLSETFDTSLSNLSSVLRESFETKLANVTAEAKCEITELADQAHEKIAGTRSELELELRDLQKDYCDRFEATLKKLEAIVSEHSGDKRNSGAARQHKAAKTREQMQAHLRRWGTGLIDSVKEASDQLEADFMRATDGFQHRIEAARTAAIDNLQRESRLMQKDIDRSMKEFKAELGELEGRLGQIEKAGHDAATTVIAYRKAMLSFGSD